MTFPKHPLRITRQPPCPHATVSSDPPNDPDPLTKAEVRAVTQQAGSVVASRSPHTGLRGLKGQPKTRSLEQRGPEAQGADGRVQPEATGTSQRGDKSLRAGGIPQQESLIT